MVDGTVRDCITGLTVDLSQRPRQPPRPLRRRSQMSLTSLDCSFRSNNTLMSDDEVEGLEKSGQQLELQRMDNIEENLEAMDERNERLDRSDKDVDDAALGTADEYGVGSGGDNGGRSGGALAGGNGVESGGENVKGCNDGGGADEPDELGSGGENGRGCDGGCRVSNENADDANAGNGIHSTHDGDNNGNVIHSMHDGKTTGDNSGDGIRHMHDGNATGNNSGLGIYSVHDGSTTGNINGNVDGICDANAMCTDTGNNSGNEIVDDSNAGNVQMRNKRK
ncbi:hypothetical protein BaRGS_00005459 [Batillaria attramentaria]|uniref:Uncharacterized protein n=1 Tax=Batillaria attramentaria TaxID=370345 RepID=A0ABD0LUB9_9CAEN